MRCLFSLFGCPYCLTASLAVQEVNITLPIGQKIQTIEVFPQQVDGQFVGDPRLWKMAYMKKNPSIETMEFPVLFVDNPSISTMFESYMKKNRDDVIIKSAYSHNHYVTMLQRFLE